MHRQGHGSVIYAGAMRATDDLDLGGAHARPRRGLVALANGVSRDGFALGVRATTLWPGPDAERPGLIAARRRPRASGAVNARDIVEAAVLLAPPNARPPVARPRPRYIGKLIDNVPAEMDDACVRELAAALLP